MECSTEPISPFFNVGVERRLQRRSPGEGGVGWDGMSPTLVEPLEMKGSNCPTDKMVGGGWSGNCTLAVESIGGWGEGVMLYPHSLQKSKVPKRRVSEERAPRRGA